MLLPILLISLGLVLLVAGAEALVRGASGLARAAGLSPLVIGLTVVAFGTSSPELAVSMKASFVGAGDLAIGNIVGSNIFNVAFILGLSAFFSPLSVHFQIIRLDMPILLLASGLFTAFCLTGEGISTAEGGILFALVIAYTAFLIRMSLVESATKKAEAASLEILGVPDEKPKHLWTQVLLAFVGLGLLMLGARFLIDNAVVLARAMGVSEAIIGLTIVAAGTSLPELATSVVAAIRKETDVAIGNIVGSNIFNLLCIGGVAGMVNPVGLGNIDRLDFAVMIAVSVLLLPMMWTGFRLVRWEGCVLMASYAGYVALRWP